MDNNSHMNNKDPMISGEKPILAQSLLNFLNSQPQNPSDRYRYKPSDNRYNDDNACTLDIGGEINHHVLNIKPVLECKNNNLGAKIYGNYSSVSPPEVGGSLQLNRIPLKPSISLSKALNNSIPYFNIGSSLPINNWGEFKISTSRNQPGGFSGRLGINVPF